MASVNVANLSGINGGKFVESGLTYAGDFIGFLPLEDSVLDSTTVCNIEDLDLSGKTLAMGLYIPGAFTNIKLVSGSGIAYRRQ